MRPVFSKTFVLSKEHAGFAPKLVRDIGNLQEIPMRDFTERICTFGDFYQKYEAFF